MDSRCGQVYFKRMVGKALYGDDRSDCRRNTCPMAGQRSVPVRGKFQNRP